MALQFIKIFFNETVKTYLCTPKYRAISIHLASTGVEPVTQAYANHSFYPVKANNTNLIFFPSWDI
jgi:hypothetical protein